MKRSIVAHSCFFIWLFLFVLGSIPVTAIAEEVGFCKAAADPDWVTLMPIPRDGSPFPFTRSSPRAGTNHG